jgi:alpha-ketoglutarate-dependent taurine dioxygenase
MNDPPESAARPVKRLAGLRRRPVSIAAARLVDERNLFADSRLPLLIEAAVPRLDLVEWAARNREPLGQKLQSHGGILFRGFDLRRASDLERFIDAVSDGALEYRERSSPRSAVAGNIYTSTDYPPRHPIFLHNENSYQNLWPLKIFFLCERPAAERGETPIADCRNVYRRIDPEVRRRFEEKGWMYVRNFGDGLGLDWRTVFQTTDPSVVEEHCRRSGIEPEWKGEERLRLRAVRRAVARHPLTGEVTWFNHATFFHVSTLEASVREALLAEFAAEDLPTNTFYGDGAPIEPQVLDQLRQAYDEETRRFPWQQGDLLMLDNLLVAHGRAPYSGERRVLVGMAEPMTWDQV